MSNFDTLHNELRLRVPNKPYEFYNDALRWAINQICVKTSLWELITTITTVGEKNVYELDMPTNTAIHSNLYIVQKGNTDKVVRRPVNGFRVYNAGDGDWLGAFKTYSKSEIQIFPTPKDGEITLEIHTAIKPTSKAVSCNNEKFFDEYKDIVVDGALHMLFEANADLDSAMYYKTKFKNGVSSIHSDVIKQNADTPLKARGGF